jgi:mono/diheme cytochrome c family protein
MKRLLMLLLVLGVVTLAAERRSPRLSKTRQAPTDLEISGLAETSGRPVFISHAELMKLDAISLTVKQDAELKRDAQYVGLPFATLLKSLPVRKGADTVFAYAHDAYMGYFTPDYIERHQPFLALMLDGKPPEQWPPSGYNTPLGPYMVSHPDFKPADSVVGQPESPQIPFGVVRLQFATAAATVDRLKVNAALTNDVMAAGQKLALRNCLACHHHDDFGGTKAQRPWIILATWAKADAGYFRRYVRNPQGVNPASKMPGFKDWSDETIEAVRSYFAAFTP